MSRLIPIVLSSHQSLVKVLVTHYRSTYLSLQYVHLLGNPLNCMKYAQATSQYP